MRPRGEQDIIGESSCQWGFCIERMLLSDVSHEPELSFGVSEVFVMCGMLWYAGARTQTDTSMCHSSHGDPALAACTRF